MTASERERRRAAAAEALAAALRFHSSAPVDLIESVLGAADEAVPVVSQRAYNNLALHDQMAIASLTAERDELEARARHAEEAARGLAKALDEIIAVFIQRDYVYCTSRLGSAVVGGQTALGAHPGWLEDA